MIGRVLTALELEIVCLHAERLLKLGLPVHAAACLIDESFAAFPHDWQALVLADMQFMQNVALEAMVQLQLANDSNAIAVSSS